jgi:hypothetical protein
MILGVNLGNQPGQLDMNSTSSRSRADCSRVTQA